MKHLCGKAIKKPVEIKFFKYSNYSITHIKELFAWIKANGENPKDVIKQMGINLYVKTLEGTSYELPENYIIIRGVKGEYYPCAPGIFEQTYNIV